MSVLIVAAIIVIAVLYGTFKFARVSFHMILGKFGMNKFTLGVCIAVVLIVSLVIMPDYQQIPYIPYILSMLLCIPCALVILWYIFCKYMDVTSSDKFWENFDKMDKELKNRKTMEQIMDERYNKGDKNEQQS